MFVLLAWVHHGFTLVLGFKKSILKLIFFSTALDFACRLQAVMKQK